MSCFWLALITVSQMLLQNRTDCGNIDSLHINSSIAIPSMSTPDLIDTTTAPDTSNEDRGFVVSKPSAVPEIKNGNTGNLSHYAFGVMETVVSNRVAEGSISAELAERYGYNFIAVYRYEDAFLEYEITYQDGRKEIVFAIDWANPDLESIDKPFFAEQWILCEVSHQLAVKHGHEGGGVRATIRPTGNEIR